MIANSKSVPRTTGCFSITSAFGKNFQMFFALSFCFCIVYFLSLPSTVTEATVLPMPTFKTRVDLGDILEDEGMKIGVELGVQKGKYADQILRRWKSAERYVLVDLWMQQENYVDLANERNATQLEYKAETLGKMEKFEKRGTKIEICQDYTINCARKFPKHAFDFIYVDARHDYKGVTQDLKVWWPLLRPGGIMAGHDYVVNKDGPAGSGQNWSINFDGTVDPSGRAVKGAVDDFMNNLGLQISVSYREAGFNTWAVRKPDNNALRSARKL